MPIVDRMGIENATHGICGFTSTLYAVYLNRPALQTRLGGALDDTTRKTRMMAEIKTFLMMMKAAANTTVLNEITELTQSFPGYGSWTIDSYIDEINDLTRHGTMNYSIAMPPNSTMEYMRTVWDFNPVLNPSHLTGDSILGLTRSGAPRNRWRDLAHYVYQSAAGRIYSWGEQFANLVEMNKQKHRDYATVYTISVTG